MENGLPVTAFALLFSAEHALAKLASAIDARSVEVGEMILNGRKGVDDVICSKSEVCFASREWNEIMERDGVAFDDQTRLNGPWAVSRGVSERNAPLLYQVTLGCSIYGVELTCFCRHSCHLFFCIHTPHETNALMLSSTSHICAQVEQARMNLLC